MELCCSFNSSMIGKFEVKFMGAYGRYFITFHFLQWYLVGFTLCLSDTGNGLIGNVEHLFLRNVNDMPTFTNEKVPQLLASIWYCLFAVITPTIILGGVAERTRFLPTVIFIFLWSTLVFDFLTYWTWNR